MRNSKQIKILVLTVFVTVSTSTSTTKLFAEDITDSEFDSAVKVIRNLGLDNKGKPAVSAPIVNCKCNDNEDCAENQECSGTCLSTTTYSGGYCYNWNTVACSCKKDEDCPPKTLCYHMDCTNTASKTKTGICVDPL